MTSVSTCAVNFKRPNLTLPRVIELVKKLYGIIVINIEELRGYDDKNFKLEVSTVIDNSNILEVWQDGYVLKIINSEESKNRKLIEAQNSLMLHLNQHGFNVPTPVYNRENELYSLVKLENSDVENVVKLLTYQSGSLLNDCKPSSQLYKNVGVFMAEVNIAMENFQHDGYDNFRGLWDLANVSQIRRFYSVLQDHKKLSLIEKSVNNFEQEVLPIIPNLEKGIIHGDFNEHNLLTENEEIKVLLDFGDAHYSPYLFELAICICYMLIHSKDLTSGRSVVIGYSKRRTLTVIEERLLKICVCARISQSLVLGLHSYQTHKDNYVLNSQQSGWQMLQKLFDCDEANIKELWQLKYPID